MTQRKRPRLHGLSWTALAVVAPCFVGHVGEVRAGQPNFAIVAAAVNTAMEQTNPRFTDARDKIMSTGFFSSGGIVNCTQFGVGTPTLGDLMQYDAVLVWSNDSFEDAVAMGNLLADYVDAGGGVVVALFANTSTNPARFLQGRWQTGDYIAIPQNGNFLQGPGELGTVLLPAHPIMNNVKSFVTRWGVTKQGMIFGGYRPVNTSLTPGSVKVAQWDTGHTLVALTPNPRVVELGFHPVSSDVNQFAYWDAGTDGDLLMANALLYVIGVPCPGDLDGDGAVGSGDLALMLGQWGPGSGSGDLDGDSMVGSADLALLLGGWGACP